MKPYRTAIFGAGTVGGGLATILLEQAESLKLHAGRPIEVAAIVDLTPAAMSARHGLPRNLFRGAGDTLSRDQAGAEIEKILNDPSIDLVVETIGGGSAAMRDLALRILDAGKNLVTANKALLALHGREIFDRAKKLGRVVGYEASVCGAIPVIRCITESFTGDEILSLSGIMNGTSNYILSRMEDERSSFGDVLRDAQALGYAEADPTLDISGGDAGHKLTILLRLIFGLDVTFGELPVSGIDSIDKDVMDFAAEINCSVKLIAYAKKDDGRVYATVRPMMVKKENILAGIKKATNAVKFTNRYAKESLLIGQGAGSMETGSAVAADIVFASRYGDRAYHDFPAGSLRLGSFDDLSFPYMILFHTEDVPGITGIVATAIGKQNVNIDTVGHNRHDTAQALFSIATMPCALTQIRRAVEDIQKNHPQALRGEVRVIPILQ